MSVKLTWASDCYQAMNGQLPTPPGGRSFSMASMPFIYQDYYATYHGATRATQVRTLLVDVLRWLRGGRSTGVVGVSPAAVDYDWYADGANELMVGAAARAAIEAAGFTVVEYTLKTADNMFAEADVVIFDGWLNAYNPDQIDVGETAPIWDYVVNQDKSILYLEGGHSASGFGSNASYAWGVGFFELYGYAGSESIFDNAFSGGQTFGVKQWGGRMSIGAGSITSPTAGLTYPSTKLAGWRNATAATHYPVFSAYSGHEDIGSFGDAW